jgi:hypothetical protein
MSAGEAGDATNLERRVSRLAAERTALFESAGTTMRLSQDDRARLSAIERELDECFNMRRAQRAVVDARRFDNDMLQRRALPRRTQP